MSGHMVAEVHCDGCTVKVVADGEPTLSELRRELRWAGWRRARSGHAGGKRALVDLCPECAERNDDETEA